MKRIAVCLLLLILSGCSGDDRLETGLALRSRLLQGNGCTFSMDILADNSREISEFSLDCTADAKGNLQFTVTDPESISGISGRLSASGGALTFDGMALDFGLFPEGELSPVSAPWIFLNTLRSGNLISACEEGEHTRLSLDDSYAEDALRLDIWLEQENPVRAEVLSAGRRILTLDVRSFVIL